MIHSTEPLRFPDIDRKSVTAQFDGQDITSDAGVLLLAAADRQLGITEAIGKVCQDKRDANKVQHAIRTLMQERIYAIACGYEDANDLDSLRNDPALKAACQRAPKADPLAGQSTISRLENAVTARDLIRMSIELAQRVIAQLPADTTQLVIDVDATEDRCHGQQELQFFNYHYGSDCYLPLLFFVSGNDGRHFPLGALLRPGNSSGATGMWWPLRKIVSLLKARFPDAQIVLRGDCGFGYDRVLRFCDRLGIDYVLGLPSNSRVDEMSVPIQMDACLKHTAAKHHPGSKLCLEYGEFQYAALTWDKPRRIIVKAEVRETIRKGKKESIVATRYLVVSDGVAGLATEAVYGFYRRRGDAENRIKEFKNGLCGDRLSCHRFLANQFRLLLHTAAAILMLGLRIAAAGTDLAEAQVSTLRAKILKVGARVVQSVRRICFHLSSWFPYRSIWRHLHERLTLVT